MKAFLFVTIALFSFDVFSQSIEEVYFKKGKLEYKKSQDAPGSFEILLYTEKHLKKPNYRHTVLNEAKLMSAVKYQSHIVIALDGKGADQVIVINENNGQVVDNFWCIFPSISPNGRFIVFGKWLSRAELAMDNWPVGETRVYDVTKSPVENRTKRAQKVLQANPISSVRASRDSGVPIYPIGDYDSPGYGYASSKEEHVGVHQQYYWYGTHSFIFDTTPINNKAVLVDVSFQEETGSFNIKTKQLSATDILASEPQVNQTLSIQKIEKAGHIIKLTLPNSIVWLEDFAQ